MNLDGFTAGEPKAATAADAWMFSRLAKLSQFITDGIEEYRFGEIARELYNFFWNEFCNWYIELSKGVLSGDDAQAKLQAQRNLVFVLDTALRLLHPVMPFVTEAIWGHLPVEKDADALMVANWPEPAELAKWIDEDAEAAITAATGVISSVRAIRARYGLSPRQELAVQLRCSEEEAARIKEQAELITSMGRISELGFCDAKPADSAVTLANGIEVYTILTGLVDFEAENAKLLKDKEKAEKELAKLQKKLSNANFVAKAAPEAVEKARAQAAELEQQLALIAAQLA